YRLPLRMLAAKSSSQYTMGSARQGGTASAASESKGAPQPILLEIPQVRRRLALLGRHQESVVAQHIVLAAQEDVLIGFDASGLGPDRPHLRRAAIILNHRPRPRQPVIDDRDFIVQDVLVPFVAVDTLFHGRMIIGVQWNGGAVERAQSPKTS